MRKSRFLLVAAILSAGSLIASPSIGELRMVEFTAQISSISAGLESIFAGGQVEGVFVYDTETVDANPSPEQGDYPGALAGFSVTFGSYAASAEAGELQVQRSGLPRLVASSNADDGVGVSGAPVGAFELIVLGFHLEDSGENVLVDDALPLDFSLEDFSSSLAFLTFRNEQEELAFVTASPLQTLVVPEPSAPIQGLLALVTVLKLRRRP